MYILNYTFFKNRYVVAIFLENMTVLWTYSWTYSIGITIIKYVRT